MKLVFIVGTGRCGSTLIHEVLAKHRSFGFVSNIEDKFSLINRRGCWNNYFYRTKIGEYTNKGSIRFAPSEAYKLISKEVSPIYQNSSRDLIDKDVTPWLEKRFKLFFETRNNSQRKPVFTHKYTGWSRMSFFSKIFPEAKFIHIVRDGRAVANSWLQMPWWGGYRGPENWLWGELSQDYKSEWLDSGRSFPALAAISWKILMESYHEAEKQLNDDRYLRLRYEDVITNPRENFENMLSFCDVQWDMNFDKHFNRQVFQTGRKRAFETDLLPEQVREIEDSLAELLSYYKYE